MIPKRIVLENFLSFGSPATEIEFAADEPLWVLGGPNGVGKSAVFDAMTYALYAEHRGGATDHASLIRHGANGFRVMFEFEFNGVAYQITRNRPLTGRPTQLIKQWADGGWNKSIQLPPAAGRQDSVKLWTERTLGLGFDAFTASVLLRQGHADEIITATGSRRLAILKKIIGAERYEALSDRIHGAARRRKERHEALCGERDVLTREKGTPPTDAEVQAARDALINAEQERLAAQGRVAAASDRLSAAKHWAKLDASCNELNRRIQEADARADAAERIRADKVRLDDLVTTVPVLKQLISLRDGLIKTERVFAERQVEAKRLTSALNAKLLREEIGRDAKCIEAADEVKKLRDEVGRFDPNHADQSAAAQKMVSDATGAATLALEAKAAVIGLLQQAKAQQQKFTSVGVGVPCSLCGQEVTAIHAERERDRLATEIREWEVKLQKSQDEESVAAKAKKAAADEWDKLDNAARNQDATTKRLADKEKTLRELGVSTDADELRRQIAGKTAEAERHETDAGDRSRADRPTLKMRLAEVQKKARADEQMIASVRGRQSTLRDQLSPSWSNLCDQMDSKTADALDTESQQLNASGVAEQYRQLEQDAVRRGEWVKQLTEVNGQIDDISPADRIPAADAEEGVRLAKEAAKDAEDKRDEAKEAAKNIADLAAEHNKLVTEIRDGRVRRFGLPNPLP